ncbi:hypothetical protein D3C78_1651050 [compost metagenome]
MSALTMPSFTSQLPLICTTRTLPFSVTVFLALSMKAASPQDFFWSLMITTLPVKLASFFWVQYSSLSAVMTVSSFLMAAAILSFCSLPVGLA